MKQNRWVMFSIVVVAAGACDLDNPTESFAEGVELARSAPDSRTPYTAIGDCRGGVVVDPGTVKIVDDVLIQRNRVIHCTLSGDVTGIVRLVQNLTLRHPGTPEATGRVFGETELIFDSYFGDENVDGTFVGPFNGSLQELLFGELAIVRHGTGQFQGMVMRGIAIQDPPGVQTETGEIFGR